MSNKLSYKGILAMGLEEKIRLRTLKGKVGYKVTKFQLMSNLPGGSSTNIEYIGKITKKPDPNITNVVDLTDDNIMAVAYYVDNNSTAVPPNDTIIIDNAVTNQDIFVNIVDAAGGSISCNYYIELEKIKLSDIEATQLTLRNLRNVASRFGSIP